MEIPYSPELVQAFWLAAGGSILAADHALKIAWPSTLAAASTMLSPITAKVFA